jgi:hypothetical protein
MGLQQTLEDEPNLDRNQRVTMAIARRLQVRPTVIGHSDIGGTPMLAIDFDGVSCQVTVPEIDLDVPEPDGGEINLKSEIDGQTTHKSVTCVPHAANSIKKISRLRK